jgi:hypothetical protein
MSSRNILMASFIGLRHPMAIIGMVAYSIAKSGKRLLGRFQRAVISIIEMETRLITTSRIWSVSMQAGTWLRNGGVELQLAGKAGFRMRHEKLPLRGICRRPESFGTSETQIVLSGNRSGIGNQESASNVLKFFRPLFAIMPKASNRFIARNDVGTLSIIGVERLDWCEDVWCLTVDDPNHWWTLANGAVTHNSNAADAGMTGAVGLKPGDIGLADGSRSKGRREVKGSQWAQ